MSKQTVNLGTAPSGSGGDTPRSAFTKSQANFDELYTALGASGSPAALPAVLPVSAGGTGGNTPQSARTGLLLDNYTAYLVPAALSLRGTPSLGLGAGLHMGWNESAGQGEVNFTCNNGNAVGGFSWRSINLANSATGGTMRLSYSGLLSVPGGMSITGACRAGADGGSNLGDSSVRWATVYAVTGAINTSDAREKTAVAPLTGSELAAAKALGSEIGSYQFLTAIAEKGDAARHHIGMTVQRAIEIMEANSLDPMRYAFICHDTWEEVPEISVEVVMGDIYSVGELAQENVTYATFEPYAQIPSFTWVETSRSVAITQEFKAGGDRYGFRYDQLAMFIARGQEERLAQIEAKLESMSAA